MSFMGHIRSFLKPLKFGYYGINGYHIQYSQGKWKSEKMPCSNSFFSKLSKEYFILNTIYGVLYIFLMLGGRALDWNLTS